MESQPVNQAQIVLSDGEEDEALGDECITPRKPSWCDVEDWFEVRGNNTCELAYAAKKLRKERVEELLKEGNDVNTVDDAGKSVLHCACDNLALAPELHDTHRALVADLLNAKANLTLTDEDDCTPLLLSVRECPWIVPMLLEAKATPTTCTADGKSPLGFCCAHNGTDVTIRALLEAKADVNTFDFGSRTPLIDACTPGIAKVRPALFTGYLPLFVAQSPLLHKVRSAAGETPTNGSSIGVPLQKVPDEELTLTLNHFIHPKPLHSNSISDGPAMELPSIGSVVDLTATLILQGLSSGTHLGC